MPFSDPLSQAFRNVLASPVAEPDLRQRALQTLAGRGLPTPAILPIPS